MNIFRAKYQAHRFVNYIFYIIVFIFGFLVGIGAKKIDLKTLIPKILMIDSVSAYNITSTIDEEYIYNQFSSNADFDISVYHNIFCLYDSSSSVSRYCYALSDEAISHTQFSYSTNGNIVIKLASSYTYNINPTSGFYLNLRNNTVENLNSWSYGFSITITYSSSKNNFYFSFIPPGYSDTSWYGGRKLLDFSSYMIPDLVYDENLFDNDSNFKKVCVNNYDTFSITSNQIQDYDDNNSPLYHSNDFIWFKNNFQGLHTYLYDSEIDSKISYFDDSDFPYGYRFYLGSVDSIQSAWNSPNSPGIELASRNYLDSNKYNYYNYTFYPFFITFTTSYRRYQIFSFKDVFIDTSNSVGGSSVSQGSSGTVHGGSGRTLGPVDNEYNDLICFYIKNEYDVNILRTNDSGDFVGDYIALGGIDFSDSTHYYNVDNSFNGYFSTLTNFMSRISSTVYFINSNVYNFFLSMPLIVRMFIISILVLFIVKLIINMIVR